jgi:3-hydroxybutyryl-CoA dehydratase
MNVTAGNQLAPLVSAPIRPEAMVRMAVVLADPNPIHLDAEVAQALGLGGRPVVQGPITVGLMLEMLAIALPGTHIERVEVRYMANAFAGDRVRITGTVDEIAIEGSSQRLRCTLHAEIEGEGRQVASGTAVLRYAGPQNG